MDILSKDEEKKKKIEAKAKGILESPPPSAETKSASKAGTQAKKIPMHIPEIPPFKPRNVEPLPIPESTKMDLPVPPDTTTSPTPSTSNLAAEPKKLNPGASTFVFKPNPGATAFKPVSLLSFAMLTDLHCRASLLRRQTNPSRVHRRPLRLLLTHSSATEYRVARKLTLDQISIHGSMAQSLHLHPSVRLGTISSPLSRQICPLSA